MLVQSVFPKLHRGTGWLMRLASGATLGNLPEGADFYAVNPMGYVPVLELADGNA